MRRCWPTKPTWAWSAIPKPSREITVIPWRAGGNGAGGRARSSAWPSAAAITPHDLNGVDFIGFDEDLPIRREVDRFLSEHGIEVNDTLHFDNLQMIKEAVAHRVGVSIMPRASCATKSRRDAWPRSARRRRTLPAAGDHPPQEEALPRRRPGVSGTPPRARIQSRVSI